MPLELRKGPDGTIRTWWYGRYKVNGRRICHNLEVAVSGKPPKSLSLRDLGDSAFERSRALAQAKLDSLTGEAHDKRNAVRLVEKLYNIQTGEHIQSVPMARLPEEWTRIPRRRTIAKCYVAQSIGALNRFVGFIKKRWPQATDITHVSRSMARDFLEAEAERGVSPRTWNESMKLMRSAMKHLLPPGGVNPFDGFPSRELATIFRKPFSTDELNAIIEAAQPDDFIRPIIVTGICTAMRRGDCCQLRWADVDMGTRFINVKTSKTGQSVSIPIFPLLYDELVRRKKVGEFVFPEQAEMYRTNAGGITDRVRKVLACAGFKDRDKTSDDEQENIRGEIHVSRKFGLRRASVRDFHSFRVTWVTLALTAGVPMEIVTKVTGHRTTDIVMKHYFQPGREEFRRTLQSAMPQLLTNGQKTPLDEARELVDALTGKNLTQTRSKLKELLAQL